MLIIKNMKIRRVKWDNHYILGDLELDFVNKNTNKAFSTIVFAGENGTGKTTILESLNSFLCFGSFKPFSFIEYEINGSIYRITLSVNKNHMRTMLERLNVSTGEVRIITEDRNETIQKDDEDLRYYGSVLSKPRADYKTNVITSITSHQLDNQRYDSDRNEDFTSLKQLIVDIQNQDSEEYLSINQYRAKNGLLPMSYDDFYPISKIYRFKNAFDSFFPTMKYEKVITVNGHKEILFNKEGVEVEIDKLSTGEKQVVFRGAYLLKNINQLKDSVVMIDEPELSMHPKWQCEILKYYKNLFFDKSNEQTVQLFVASHSEAVISAALKDMDKSKVIVLNRFNNKVTSNGIINPAVLPYTLAAEVNYQAFGVLSTDYHNALYGYMEAEGWKTEFDALQDSVQYTKLKRNGSTEVCMISMTEKIRHIIHHPENSHNSYSAEDLQISIDKMRRFIIHNS